MKIIFRENNEELIENMMLQFKETTQELPNFQLPEIQRTPVGYGMDSSMGFTDLRDIKMNGAKLKISQPLRK